MFFEGKPARFERKPSALRYEVLRALGLDPDRPTISYLGSSTIVAPQEPGLIAAWSAAVRSSTDGRVRGANLLVRPHPQTVETATWTDWRPPPSVVVTPRVVQTRAQDVFDQVSSSDAVVALNTSASIEAAILGKPVLTIKAGDRAPGQEGQINFGYLLEENGGFVQTAASLDEHAAQLSEALARDPLAARRTEFLRSFVRPRGLDIRAGVVLANELEALGTERNGARGRSRLGALLGRARLVATR